VLSCVWIKGLMYQLCAYLSLVVSIFSAIHFRYIPVFPFDLPMQSDTYPGYITAQCFDPLMQWGIYASQLVSLIHPSSGMYKGLLAHSLWSRGIKKSSTNRSTTVDSRQLLSVSSGPEWDEVNKEYVYHYKHYAK